MQPEAHETTSSTGRGYAQKNLTDSYNLADSGFSDTIKGKVSADNNELFYDTVYQELEMEKRLFL